MNVPYHAAVARSKVTRSVYAALLEPITAREVSPPCSLPFRVYSFSGEADLPEQVASIRSFLRHAGAPERFTVVSDGSHATDSAALLHRLHPCVQVQPLEELTERPLPQVLRRYAALHPLGKKLSLLVSLVAKGPTIYVDSDVLFFPRAAVLAEPAYTARGAAFYLPDCKASLDEHVLVEAGPSEPVNSGFLVWHRQLDWGPGLAALDALRGDPGFFTEQSVVHVTMHSNSARPLDPTRFVVGLADQFRFRDAYHRATLALRHYVRPVRYRFWTQLLPPPAAPLGGPSPTN